MKEYHAEQECTQLLGLGICGACRAAFILPRSLVIDKCPSCKADETTSPETTAFLEEARLHLSVHPTHEELLNILRRFQSRFQCPSA